MGNKDVTAGSKISKKNARRVIYEKLAVAMAEYKNSIKEKRFTANLKKASNLFAGDIAKAMKKKNGKLKTKPEKAKKEVLVKTADGAIG